MVKKKKCSIKIFETFDRKEAIKDADYIITQIRVGQLAMRRNDECISIKHGVIGQEITGAGGIMKALRIIQVLLDFCWDIEELAQSAYLIIFRDSTGLIYSLITNII